MTITLDQLVIFAVRGKNLELAKERIEAGGNINYQDSKHGSALLAAINNKDEGLLQLLIDNGVNLNQDNSHGICPLEIALHHSSSGIVKKLAWCGAQLNKKSRPHWQEKLEACLRDS